MIRSMIIQLMIIRIINDNDNKTSSMNIVITITI